MVQFSAVVIDAFVAPKASALNDCLAPELLPFDNHFNAFFLNNLIAPSVSDKERPLAVVFFRRLADACRHYRNGRDHQLACVGAQQHSAEMVAYYLKSLASFEMAVINAYLALMAHNAVARSLVTTEPRPFTKQDGTAAQRLNAIYNAIKHFDDNVLKGAVTDVVTPMWLVNDGVESSGSEGPARLTYSELVGLFGELDADAKWLSQEVYDEAHKRVAQRRRQESP